MKCSKNLFSNTDSIVIPSNWDYSGVNSVVSEIIQEFQDSKVNYLLLYDGTTDKDSYIESIDLFIETLLSKIPLEFNEYDKGRIVNLLKIYYYPNDTRISREKDNIPISAIIPEADLISKHEANEIKLDTLLSEFFGTNSLLKTYCKNVFKHDIFGATVILRLGKNSQVVTNIGDLNTNIENYKNLLYKNIYEFMISRGIDPELHITLMFVQSGESEHKINPGYLKVLDDFYMLINSPQLQEQLEIEWVKEQTTNTKSPLLQAINSYIHLLYFDELLENSTENYLSINDDMDLVIMDDGNGDWIYKYSFGETNRLAHDWKTEVKDATKELGTFSRFLVENIPLRNSTSYMTIMDYFTAMLKLKDHMLSSDDEELEFLAQDLHNHPEESFRRLFQRIFTKDGNIREDIKLKFELDNIDYKLNPNDYRVIESLYDFLYNGKDSVYNIETKLLSVSGITSQYPILKSIIGAIDSTSLMDYAEVVYNYDALKYEVKVKKKYASKKSLYDYIDNINRKTREKGREILYNSWFDNNKKFHILIGDLEYIIDSSDTGVGILNSRATFKISMYKDTEEILSPGSHLTTYFGINLDTISSRQKLIDRVNLSEKELLFMDLIDFLDYNLGTTFGQDEQGLLEFNLYLGNNRISEGRLKEILLGAAKSQEVMKLHKGFADLNKTSNFREYLKDEYPFEDVSKSYLDKDVKKKYFYSNYRGEFLYGLSKQDRWVDNLIEARRIISGESTLAVTKNLEGSSIPNTSPAFLGREIKQVISDLKVGATLNLIFNQKLNAIVGVVIDTDVRTNTGKVKSVASFSSAELLYHNFINKFVLPMQRGRMLIQPTVYSDKKKFILYDIDVNEALGNPYRMSNKEFELKYMDTIGLAYYLLYDKVIEDYKRIYPGKSLQEINNLLRTKSSEDFIKDAQEAGVDVMEDIHYRKGINGRLSINELLQYYSDMYNDPIQISKRLTAEKYKFINQLSKNRVSFAKSDELNAALYEIGAPNWFKDDLMVLAKDKDGNNILYGDIPSDAVINPLLEKYFYTSSLLSNNLRLALIGTELNHKVKDLKGITATLEGKFDDTLKKFIRKYAKLKKSDKINLPDIKFAIDNYKDSLGEIDLDSLAFILNILDIYEAELYKIETAEQNAQLKRTVPVPGTMRYFLLDTLDGIADTMRCAVIEDIPAEVYQYSGKQDDAVDAHDGSAFIDPITSILENKSLLDSEVGTIKKTLWHDFNEQYMSAELVKYAQHTITNLWMRLSENSAIKMYDMFRKMADAYHWDESQIPDITNMAWHKDNTKLNFSLDILQGNMLFYKFGDLYRRIEDFGKDEFGYYTDEIVVTSEGVLDNSYPKVRYYHIFNGRNHYRVPEGESIPEGHTISSIFELHAALGGIYSMSLMDDNNLHYSEASNYAVANFVNNVTIPKVDLRTKPSKTQSNFELPLKKMMINYLLNLTSIKNGAQNINKKDVYFNEDGLRSFTLSTRRYGILLDSDHEADEARMTEFSLVISSLDAGGHYHDFVKEVYQVLGLVAIEASLAEIQAVEEFNREGNYDKLYDTVGRIIILNMSLGSGKAGLAESIIQSLKKKFNLSTNHAEELKIPFSDPNMYSLILSTISSLLNKKSIKREYPGNGMVMTPGYKICQLWDIDGKTLLFEDILKQVLVVPNFGESISDANRRTVKEFLNLKLLEIPILGLDKAQSFYPSDNVNIHYTINGENFIEVLELDTMYKYQNFIKDPESNIKEYLLSKNIIPEAILGILKNITIGRDLAPAKITYSYLDAEGNLVDTNVFASYVYREAHGDPTKELREAIQRHLNNLDEGFIYLSKENELAGIKTPIFNFKSTAAETIVSNIYLSKFGLNYYDSINDVDENKLSISLNTSYSPLYDIALIKGNGRNTYISIDSTTEDKQIKSWKNISKFDSTFNGKPIRNIYVVNDDNVRLFQVGREVIMDNYSYNDGKFYNEKGELVLGEYSWDGRNVWKYILFIENTKASLNNGKNFRYYNINKAKLEEVFLGSLEELDNFISKLIKDIYNSDSYQVIVPNNNLATSKLDFLSTVFYDMASQTKENPSMQLVLFDISGLLHGLKGEESDKVSLRKKKIGSISYQTYMLKYLDTLVHKKYVSFLKSKDFTSSRIPAQTLLSFMYMKAVGFTGVPTNQVYVSHFQTYLQGSDYDIDKSYMLGHEFDDNGIYLGWSSLFDYTTIETLHASENLPFPKGRVYEKSNKGVDINEFVLAISLSTGVERINNIARLLKFLNNLENLYISYNGDDSILDLINQHEATYLSPLNKVAVLKNFVSSHILKLILATKNMMAAYSPIEMSDLLRASRTTPKALNSSGLSVLNPAMIAIMLNQNMVGKNVVGIAANGQKANLMWNYYMNDVVRLPEDSTEREYSKFTFTSSRIHKRFEAESKENLERSEELRVKIESVEIHGLPDTNWNFENWESVKSLYDNPLRPTITSDLMESQFISAATDNAKELILDKINSGLLTAKCYLYLVTLGFDVKDIVKFMTSPAVSFIESMSQENIFNGYFSTLEDITKDLINNCINISKRDNDITRFLRGKTSEEIQEIKADAIEFKRILAGANEFSNLGKILGINLGVPTTKENLAGWKRAFNNIILLREKYLGIVDDNGNYKDNDIVTQEERIEFDFDRYFKDAKYREELKLYYNKIKECVNIFALIDHIPHFKAMFELLNVVNTFDSNISIKSKLNNYYMEEANKKLRRVDDNTTNKINSAINTLLIQYYISLKGLSIPTKQGWTVFDELGSRITSSGNDILLTTPETLKSFQFIFELYIIPQLLGGNYFDSPVTLKNGETMSAEDANNFVKRNPFIKGLVTGNDGNIPLYKLDIDMLSVDTSPISKIKYLKYLDGFIDLHNILINGISLSDWFMVYNLVRNKNNYGRDRFTTLFQELIKNNSGYLLSDYLKYIGDKDYYKDIYDDIINNNSLEAILLATAKTVKTYTGLYDMYVKKYDESGEPKYYVNRTGRRGAYEETSNGIPYIEFEDNASKKLRIADNEEYGFGLLTSNYANLIFKQLQSNWATTIGALIERGYIHLENKCD